MISWGLLLLLSACEIEDDFGKSDTSEKLGTVLYNSSANYLTKILWSAETNEIIAVSDYNIFAIDIATKARREILTNVYYAVGSETIWIAGDMLYILEYDARLSRVNLVQPGSSELLLDSAVVNYNTTPFSANHFAFNKWDLLDPAYEPYLFLYDLNTKKESLITTGIPITFSTDGQKLLFSSKNNLHYYDLQTKAIVSLPIQSNYGYQVIKWTSEGVLFFYQPGNYTVLYNATTNHQLGQWENYFPLAPSIISDSGKKLITQKQKCASPYITGNCPILKPYYYIVDVVANTEAEIVYSNYPTITQFIFSPSENSIAFIKDSNSIYLAEQED